MMFDRPDGKYVVFLKPAKSREVFGARVVCLSVGGDLRSFSEPRLILKPDLADTPNVEFYGFAAFPYADMYLGLIERYNGVPDYLDMIPAWSYNLEHWHRPMSREAFIGPEYYWNRGWSENNTAPPIQVGNQLWFYFGGRSGAHSHSKQQGPRQYAAVGLATITVDRFASISAGFLEGKLVTKPMIWPGGDLLLNASTTRYFDSHPLNGGGDMSVEIWDGEGHPIEEFAGEQRARFDGNAPTRTTTEPALIKWPDNRSLYGLAGRNIRLVFYMRDSHLYSFRSSG